MSDIVVTFKKDGQEKQAACREMMARLKPVGVENAKNVKKGPKMLSWKKNVSTKSSRKRKSRACADCGRKSVYQPNHMRSKHVHCL